MKDRSHKLGASKRLLWTKLPLALSALITVASANFCYSTAAASAKEEDGGRVGTSEEVSIPSKAFQIADFAPPGWEVFKSDKGDLNGDGKPDLACIIIKKDDDPEGFGNQPDKYKRILVVAFSQPDGSFLRDDTGYGAVMSGPTARNFALSVVDVRIERGNVVVTNGNSATYIETYDSKYRKQDGKFELIGITRNYGCIREDDQFSASVDRNLNTGYIEDNYSKRKSSKSTHFYALRAGLAKDEPTLDGQMAAGEWVGRTVHLKRAECIASGKSQWKSASDLGANLQALRTKSALFIVADVTGSRINDSDELQLVDEHGKTYLPTVVKKATANGHEIIECRFDLEKFPKNTRSEGTLLPPRLALSVEIINKAAGEKTPLILSTSCGGKDYTGEISLAETSALPTLANWTWEHPDD